jgi:hypothetical protein
MPRGKAERQAERGVRRAETNPAAAYLTATGIEVDQP